MGDWMDEWMNWWTYFMPAREDVWLNGALGCLMNEWMNGWMNEFMD